MLHQGTIGKGWPSLVATVPGWEECLHWGYEVVIVPCAIDGFPTPPRLLI